eukprot:scaffold2442_cov146-Cylindrotheca_fusiformis.AAC.20
MGNTTGMVGNFGSGRLLAGDDITEITAFPVLGNGRKKRFKVMVPRGLRHLEESSITEEQAEAACTSMVDALDRKDCVSDILPAQDMGMAGAYQRLGSSPVSLVLEVTVHSRTDAASFDGFT